MKTQEQIIEARRAKMLAPHDALPPTLVNVFPTHALPEWIRSFVAATADALEVPDAMVATLTLGALSYAAAGRYKVQLHSSWSEHPVLFLMLIANPAERKSPAFRRVFAPLRASIREASERIRAECKEIVFEQELLDQSISNLTKVIVKASTTEIAGKKLALAAKRSEREALVFPRGPALLMNDATPEVMAINLQRSGGIGAIVTEEGATFANQAKGQYSSGSSNLGLLCHGFDGEPYRVDRVGREPVDIDRALLTIAVALQPSVLQSLGTEAIRGQGLFARFLFSKPPSQVGHRPCNVTDVPHAISQRYAHCLASLAAGDIPSEPGRLCLSDEAWDRFNAYRKEIEPRLAADLAPMADFGGKYVGKVARIAGLLHMADRAGEIEPCENDLISADTVNRAIALGDYFLREAIDVYGALEAGKPAVELDGFESRLKAKFGYNRFTARDVQRAKILRGRPATEVKEKLVMLVDGGSLQALAPESTKHDPGYQFVQLET